LLPQTPKLNFRERGGEKRWKGRKEERKGKREVKGGRKGRGDREVRGRFFAPFIFPVCDPGQSFSILGHSTTLM